MRTEDAKLVALKESDINPDREDPFPLSDQPLNDFSDLISSITGRYIYDTNGTVEENDTKKILTRD